MEKTEILWWKKKMFTTSQIIHIFLQVVSRVIVKSSNVLNVFWFSEMNLCRPNQNVSYVSKRFSEKSRRLYSIIQCVKLIQQKKKICPYFHTLGRSPCHTYDKVITTRTSRQKEIDQTLYYLPFTQKSFFIYKDNQPYRLHIDTKIV